MSTTSAIFKMVFLLETALLWSQASGATARAEEPSPSPSARTKEIDKEEWGRKLAALKEADWPTAFAVGKQLAAVPADEGFAILKENWAKSANVDGRQQFLKAWYWAETKHGPHTHPRLLDVLDLGVRDPAPAVQSWAFDTLRDISFQEFAEDFQAYKTWYQANCRKPTAKVIAESAKRLVATAAQFQGKADLKAAQLLSEHGRAFGNVPAARQAVLDAGLLEILERWVAGAIGDKRQDNSELARVSLHMIAELKPDEAYLRRVVVPLLAKDKPAELRSPAVQALGGKKNGWAVDLLLDVLTNSLRENKENFRDIVWHTARALAEIGDPKAIPVMIALIDADNTSDTVYWIGYFGLTPLTGVRYNESHNGAWWRQWWEKNKERYPTARRLKIPKIPKRMKPKGASEDDTSFLPASVRAGDETNTLLDILKRSLQGDEDKFRQTVWDTASALAKIGDPKAIPVMIAVIDADNTEDTVYGLGYFGLTPLTGVRYDESHKGGWWRKWWEKNKERYPTACGLKIPKLTKNLKPRDPLADIADVPVQDLRAGGDAKKRYFLVGLREGAKPPAEGYRLLIVLPGGNGSADFQPFVRRIYQNVLDENWLIAQPVAPKWDDKQFDQVVWPTEKLSFPAAKFTTEAFLEAVLADVKTKTPIDAKRVYLLGWSSGGPPCYSLALRKGSPVAGAFIAMSVFKPEQMPALANAKGKAFYLLQSPEDRVTPLRFAETAEKTLRANGAKVRLQRYDGGHGWHGDVWEMIQDGLTWLQQPGRAKP